MSAIVLEVLDKRGHVVSRTRVQKTPTKVGRGYGCDVLIDDPYVAAAQFEIHHDAAAGEVSLRALNTENPTRIESHAGGEAMQILTTGVNHILVRPFTRVSVGKTNLRIVIGEPAVAPTQKLEAAAFQWHQFTSIGVVCALALTALKSWFGMIDEIKFTEIAAAVMSVFGALLAWSGGWAFITRLLQGITRFQSHLAVVSLAFVATLLGGWLIDTVSFSMNMPSLTLAAPLVFGAISLGTLLAHLQLANGHIGKRVSGAIVAGFLGIAVFSMIGSYQTFKTVLPSRFLTTVLPPSWRVSGESSLDHLFDQASQKRQDIEALQKLESDDDGFLE